MMRKNLAKRLALGYLPDDVLRMLRASHYRKSLKNYSLADEPDLLACQSILKLGDTVLDVGANIGVYTRFCSEFVGSTGRVLSLEPVPETFSYLTRNVRALKLKNVECLNVAASDHDSESERMSIPEYAAGGSNLYEAKLTPDGNVRVKAAKLDTLFPELNPAFVKCDVEGHEVACIRGSVNLIRRSRSVWMVEVIRAEVFELFNSLGYQTFTYSKGEFRPFDSDRPSVNYFFFPAERV